MASGYISLTFKNFFIETSLCVTVFVYVQLCHISGEVSKGVNLI